MSRPDRHAGPPGEPERESPPVPEPSYAERARTLVHRGRTGALATVSRKHPGHPFASVMPYAIDESGQPLFLISTLAMHTQNLHADPRASLLVTETDGPADPRIPVPHEAQVHPSPFALRTAARGPSPGR